MMFPSVANAEAALHADWRWPNFSIAELACRCHGRFCNGQYWHDPAFLDGLQALREQIGTPLIISSGHRCAQWNAAVGGAPLSMHKSIAADISLSGHDRFGLREVAEALGFTGIGLGKKFIHIDQRANPAHWYYKGSYSLWQT